MIKLDITKLDLKESDTVLVKIDEYVDVEAFKRIKDAALISFPNNRCVVYPKNIEISTDIYDIAIEVWKLFDKEECPMIDTDFIEWCNRMRGEI